ncbi:E3 ubiquitin-protein ligase PDZRN3-B-like [Pungitius pungitius]|uniref:E3 ubiquitin-protein ligase PDZRN3-B-like n=1 Tax=Pungitius pungitius TaxID=134920 RepID=UPI002E0DA6FE
MESQSEPGSRPRGAGVRPRARELPSRCVDALRTAADALEERSATLEHETRMARLRWNRREQSLLARVSTLHDEARLSALRYQRRLHQHMLHIKGIAEQVTGYCERDARTPDAPRSQMLDTATGAEGEPRGQPEAAELI